MNQMNLFRGLSFGRFLKVNEKERHHDGSRAGLCPKLEPHPKLVTRRLFCIGLDKMRRFPANRSVKLRCLVAFGLLVGFPFSRQVRLVAI